MSAAGWITLAVVATTVVVLARDLVAPAVAVLVATITLLVLGIIEPGQAFAGFANPAPITVAALYVLARAVDVTGVLEPILARLLNGRAEATRSATRRRVARMVGPAAMASAFLNNTPIVAMTAPQVAEWAARRRLPAAPLLMPLSFAAILGGLLTAIGTSTNLVVSSLLVEAGHAPIGLFEISKVGLPLAVSGVGAIVLLAPRVLPERRTALQAFSEEVREFSVAMRVVPGGPLDGASVQAAGLRDLHGVYLARIDRDGRVLAPVAPHEGLSGEDVLTFVGKVDLIVDLQRRRGLESTEQAHLEGLSDARQTFFEAVVGAASSLRGRTLKEAGFRARYGAAVIALHRAGRRVDAKLGTLQLRAGDTLLLIGDDSFVEHWKESRDFLLVAAIGGTPPGRTRKAPAVAVIAAALLLLAGTGILPILEAALLAAFGLVAVGALTLREARQAVDLDVVVLIAAAFGLGEALQVTGVADALARLLVDALAPLGALGALAGVLVATVVLTELVTNNAAAVLAFPVALSTAVTVGASPRPFAMAVAVAASASFLTPIGYQTNTMVYGLGGYRFGDYARLGAPLTALVVALSLVVIPVAWPL